MERNRTKTIKSLLEADFTQLPAHRIEQLEKTDRIQQLRRHLQDNVPDHQWHLVREEIVSQMAQLLEIPLQPILIKSWHTHEAVKREIAQQQAHPDNQEASIVVLDAHEIRSTHSPTLATKIGQQNNQNNTVDLRFFIGIVLQLKNISLKIQQGEIKSVLAGVMSGNGFMQYQNVTLIEQDFRHLKLAGDIDATIATHQPVPAQQHTQPIIPDPISDNRQPITANHTNTTDITTENRQEKKPASVIKTNIIQFILGVLLALVLLFLFWQFGRN